MDWFGPCCNVETLQDDSVLFFRVIEIRRKVDYLIPIVLVVACGFAIGFGSIVFGLFLGACAALFSYRLLELATYRVEVTAAKLSSTGSLGKFGGSSTSFRWTEIHGLEYGNLGEDGPSGLCVRTGRWSLTCIAPGVSREQADAMIFQIYKRFPSPPLADPPPPLATMLKQAIRVLLPSNRDDAP
jgi:hypothetical protein